MASKPKAAEAKVPVLKGQEAEDKILEYIRRMNRPFGAVDVSANLKGAVPKTATQKILVALAEKGELVQKTYGKTTFFVANQDKLEEVSTEKLAGLEKDHKDIEEENKFLAAEVRALSTEVAKLRATPTDAELAVSLEEAISATDKARKRLAPLRSGTLLVSATELAQLDADWTQWRGEWVRRKKIFTTFWQLATDPLPPQEASELADDLGIELDTGEHAALEHGPLCASAGGNGVLGKRRR
ncbi:TBPIP-domain-containing protein [Fomitopsis serialis]|uniref:TBPIP-domain-containing protein n=1 Tax=Fomitopsis serialis TaxID=139415 RepID=UPI002007E439|nr:TBPIP-domain-containing protein [Neoantrodia serialis]KAH9918298.1 TBPIP-domain-containing protein [Neoantrodia serialis]